MIMNAFLTSGISAEMSRYSVGEDDPPQAEEIPQSRHSASYPHSNPVEAGPTLNILDRQRYSRDIQEIIHELCRLRARLDVAGFEDPFEGLSPPAYRSDHSHE